MITETASEAFYLSQGLARCRQACSRGTAIVVESKHAFSSLSFRCCYGLAEADIATDSSTEY
jgi:hypothetical protein